MGSSDARGLSDSRGDSLVQLQELAARLEREGYRVLLADTNSRAVEIPDAAENDSALISVATPVRSGNEGRVRKGANRHEVPLVIVAPGEKPPRSGKGGNGTAGERNGGQAESSEAPGQERNQLHRRWPESDDQRAGNQGGQESRATAGRPPSRTATSNSREVLDKLERRKIEFSQALSELEQTYDLVSEQHAQMLAAERGREELIALVVHDLRNPLTCVLGNARYLDRDAQLSPEARASLRDLLNASDSMHRMVLNLLEISRSENGSLALRPSRFDLVELIEEVRGEMGRRAADNDQVIIADRALAPLTIHADRDLVRRLLENLLDNGLRYTPGGGTIHIRASAAGDEFIELRVRDEGPGVAAEYREKIFEKYTQIVTASERQMRRGRGLGLAFCRMAAEAHGGRIWVECPAPVGSEFCVRLPRK